MYAINTGKENNYLCLQTGYAMLKPYLYVFEKKDGEQMIAALADEVTGVLVEEDEVPKLYEGMRRIQHEDMPELIKEFKEAMIRNRLEAEREKRHLDIVANDPELRALWQAESDAIQNACDYEDLFDEMKLAAEQARIMQQVYEEMAFELQERKYGLGRRVPCVYKIPGWRLSKGHKKGRDEDV